MFRKKNNYQKVAGTYISEIDKHLSDFDQSHTRSDTQQEELTKYKRIFYLRNNPSFIIKGKDLWDFE
ncbi:CBU_0585 family protein [Coxiella endosymbiont of Dermacentor marginatus]|uniref:CBU_0585 family protein n=1 Tax=Coxiella endosymbiont of Dermacentor marginatus TaxID=1656159 RepID=UPI0029CA9FDB|nr:CBU_0585 family protein [Coxiella endosymbiont of Dermacentor marginatus]